VCKLCYHIQTKWDNTQVGKYYHLVSLSYTLQQRILYLDKVVYYNRPSLHLRFLITSFTTIIFIRISWSFTHYDQIYTPSHYKLIAKLNLHLISQITLLRKSSSPLPLQTASHINFQFESQNNPQHINLVKAVLVIELAVFSVAYSAVYKSRCTVNLRL
jgi:hypothetical protein